MFAITALAPCVSASMARMTERGPDVVAPVTPTSTGRPDTCKSACVIAGWHVNGAAASTASALLLRMMYKSVENTSVRMVWPISSMPGQALAAFGARTSALMSLPCTDFRS